MRTFFGFIGAVSLFGLWLLGIGIYLLTLYFAYRTGFVPMLLTLIFPMIGQVVWLWIIWGTTGVFFNYYTMLCITWLVLGAISIAMVSAADRRTA